jgi:SH3-like domain-containing protein
MRLSLRNKAIVTVAAFGAIGLSILPADLDAVQSVKPVIAAKPAPTFNAPPIPQEALNKAPILASAAVSRPAETVTSWRPLQASPTQPVVMQAALASSVPSDLRADTVNSAVNVRTEGKKGSPVLFVLPAGAAVQVAETNDGWVHVYSDRGEGWVYSSFIGAAPRAPEARVASSQDGAGRTLRLASAVTVRDEPGGDAIYELDAGERIRIVEVEGRWVRIVTSTGEGGWVRLR